MPPKSRDAPVIIKRKKHAAHGAHGGSWKVAYADFVTAMMAFFLLMWLVAMVEPQKREQLSQYFNEFDVFKGSASMFEGQGGSAVNLQDRPAAPGPEVRAKAQQIERKDLTPEELQSELTSTVDLKLGDMKDQVSVDRVPGGVRIQLQYKEGRPIFDSGSAGLTEAGRGALAVLGQALGGLANHVVVEGHTDAVPLNRTDYNNWDLSASRALSAMHFLVNSGLDPDKVVRVSGFAAKQPLLADNPQDPRNRRISILVLDKPPAPAAGQDAPAEPPAPVFRAEEPAPETPPAKPASRRSGHDLAP